MPTVPGLLFEGLAEGLALRSIEREPATPAALAGRFEHLFDTDPPPSRLTRLVRRLADADRIRADADASEPVYRLTQDGARRLQAYRGVPGPLKATLVQLFDIEEAGAVDGMRLVPDDQGGPPPDQRTLVDDRRGWTRAALARLPASPDVEAAFARFSLDHDSGSHAWALRVEQHEPRPLDDPSAGPLDFLYAAAMRLLYTEPPVQPAQPRQASSP